MDCSLDLAPRGSHPGHLGGGDSDSLMENTRTDTHTHTRVRTLRTGGWLLAQIPGWCHRVKNNNNNTCRSLDLEQPHPSLEIDSSPSLNIPVLMAESWLWHCVIYFTTASHLSVSVTLMGSSSFTTASVNLSCTCSGSDLLYPHCSSRR